MHPDLQVYPDIEALRKAAAERIVTILDEAHAGQETAAFVLTGGDTPKPVYETLASLPYRERVAWGRIHFFWGDERCVPPDHPDSNFGMAWKSMLSKLPIPPGHIHRMRGEMPDPEEAAALYDQEIRNVFGSEALPSFDLVLHGMGDDGHTASLFPGATWDEERLTIATSTPANARRISMTPRILNAAKNGIFLVAGSRKAAALSQVIDDPGGDLPASRIRPTRGTLVWMVDTRAARLLRR